MTVRFKTHKPRSLMKMLSIHRPSAGRCLIVVLAAFTTVLLASPALASTVTWDAGGANENWNTAANWDPSDTPPGTGDDVLFDGSLAGVANSISLNANFQIQGLRVQEPLQNNWDVLNAGGGTLTLQDNTDNAVFIEYDSWRTSPGVGYHSRLYAPIIFNDPLTITKTGGGQELKIHTSLTGGANGVTFNGASLNETILFFNESSMSWSGTTTVEQGRVGINNADSMQIGSAGLTVTMATVGDAEIQWKPAFGSSLSNDNNFVLGTAGKSWFDMFRGFSSATTLTLEGDFTGGATGVTLDFSVNQQTIATDTFILTGDINVDSQLRFLVGVGTPPNGTIRLNGTITKADGGCLIEAGANLDGSGTIKFTLASGTTTGPSNFGDLPIDLDGTLDISAMTADFTGSTVDGASDYPLIVIDGGATLTGPFASEIALPAGYHIVYGASEVTLAAPALPADLTWDDGEANGLWDTTSQNWSGAATWNNSAPDTATFGATGVGTVTLDENISAGAVTFDTAGYTIAGGGNTLTMQGDLTANESASITAPLYLSVVDDLQTWVVANGKTLTLSDVTGQSGVNLNIVTGGDGSSNILDLPGTLDLQGNRIILNGTRLDYSASGSIVSANNYVILGHTLNTTMNVTGGSLSIDAGTGKITIGTRSTSTVTVSDGTLSLTSTGASEKGVTIGGDWQVGDGGAGVLTVNGSGLVQVSSPDITFAQIDTTPVGGETAASGTLNLDGGTLETAASFILGTSAPVGTGTINFNGGTLKATGANADWIGAGIACNVQAGGAIIDTDGNNDTIEEPLVNDGGGGLIKRGNGTLTLTGANTYAGDTKVEAGTLSINSAYLADGADVYLTGGTTFDLNHANTDTIRSLYIDGVLQFAGTWGANGSGAEHQNTMFTGAGKLNVTAGSASCIIADFNDSPEVLPGTIPTEANLDDGSAHGSWTIIQRGVTVPPDSGNGETAIKTYSDAAGDHYLEIDKSPTAGVAPEYDLDFDSTVPLDGTYAVSFDIVNHRAGPSGSGADKTDLIVGYDASGDILFQLIVDAASDSATYLGVGVVGQTTSSETVNAIAFSSQAATTDMTTIAITLGATTFDVTVGGNVAYTGISYDSVVTDLSRLKFTAMDPNKQFAGYSVDNVKVEVPQTTSSTGAIFMFR